MTCTQSRGCSTTSSRVYNQTSYKSLCVVYCWKSMFPAHLYKQYHFSTDSLNRKKVFNAGMSWPDLGKVMMKTSVGLISKSFRASMSLGRSFSLTGKFIPLYLNRSEVIMSRESMCAEKNDILHLWKTTNEIQMTNVTWWWQLLSTPSLSHILNLDWLVFFFLVCTFIWEII